MLGCLSIYEISNAMEKLGKAEYEVTQQYLAKTNSIESKLRDAILSGNLDQVKEYLENGVNLNVRVMMPNVVGSTYSLLGLAIKEANMSIRNLLPHRQKRLDILELLLQNGAAFNDPIYGPQTALEYAIASGEGELPVIRLLLGYGATITDRSLELAQSTPNKAELLHELDLHKQLLEAVQTNPTEELLQIAIQYNQPYVVKLIVESKPKLVTLPFIELARTASPASMEVLIKAFGFAKIRGLVGERKLPNELTEYIEKFIGHNK